MNLSNSRFLNVGRFILPLIAGLGFSVSALGAETTFTVQPAGFPLATLPANGSAVFTFSPAIANPADLHVRFYYLAGFTETDVTVNTQWSAGNTVLTVTAPGGFPTTGFSGFVFWELSSDDPELELVNSDPNGDTSGVFSVTSGGTGTGSGTNQFTSYLLGKVHFYAQTNSSAPVPDPDFMETGGAYGFSALTTLASNRTASAISLSIPGGGTGNLSAIGAPEDWIYFAYTNTSANLDAAFASGSYTFHVTGNPSKDVPLTFPANLVQPNAPHIANHSALQSADAAQAITINWDPFQGGTAADYIQVDVGDAFRTPDFTEPGALAGNQASVTIPAGKLQPNTSYDVTIGFYRANFSTNASAAEFYGVYRVTLTATTLVTGSSGTPGGPLSFGNPLWSGNAFSFEVNCAPGQTLTIETTPTLQSGSWSKWFTTNAPGNKVRIVDPRAPTAHLFYRARNGS